MLKINNNKDFYVETLIEKNLNDDCDKDNNNINNDDCKYIYNMPNINDFNIKEYLSVFDKQIYNKKKAEELFTTNYFIQLTMEDQANTNMMFGGSIDDFIKIFNSYIIPTYLKLLDVKDEVKENITNFYLNTEKNFNLIDKNLNNFFNLENFFSNMTTDFFNKAPLSPEYYNI